MECEIGMRPCGFQLPCKSQPRNLSGRELAAKRAEFWGSFLRHVADLKPPTEPVYLNGEPAGLRFPTLQEAIGLSDLEAAKLSQIARKCDSALSALERASGGLMLNARIEAIDPSQAKSAYLLVLRPFWSLGMRLSSLTSRRCKWTSKVSAFHWLRSSCLPVRQTAPFFLRWPSNRPEESRP
jgi:hypothetical protein